MRFSTTLSAASLIAISLAQKNAPGAATQSCLNACSPGDVTCAAVCVGTAHPTTADVNATNDCAANCDQGDGSAAASQKYSMCVQACIASHFPSSQTVVPVIPGGPNTAVGGASATIVSVSSPSVASPGASMVVTPTPSSGSGSGSGSGKGGNGGGSSGSQTAASASAQSTGAAASNFKTGGSVASLAGLLMAVFAL